VNGFFSLFYVNKLVARNIAVLSGKNLCHLVIKHNIVRVFVKHTSHLIFTVFDLLPLLDIAYEWSPNSCKVKLSATSSPPVPRKLLLSDEQTTTPFIIMQCLVRFSNVVPRPIDVAYYNADSERFNKLLVIILQQKLVCLISTCRLFTTEYNCFIDSISDMFC